MSKFTIVHYVSNNWGDALNRPLFNFLAQQECDFKSMFGDGYRSHPHILGIGSILSHAGGNATVWGSGFIQSGGRIAEAPRKICAVRGPRSRKRLVELKFKCPEIYGDPALLYPLVYNPTPTKKYKWGVIPHYVDFEDPFCATCTDCLVIDIRKPINEVVDQLIQCERIISSSLHGLIAADSYRIPSTWIRLSDKVVGGDFKFLDYFESVGRRQKKPVLCDGKTFRSRESDLDRNLSNGKIRLDLRPLLDHCPVLTDKEFKGQLKKKVVKHYAT